MHKIPLDLLSLLEKYPLAFMPRAQYFQIPSFSTKICGIPITIFPGMGRAL
jgi:hypothetical protein